LTTNTPRSLLDETGQQLLQQQQQQQQHGANMGQRPMAMLPQGMPQGMAPPGSNQVMGYFPIMSGGMVDANGQQVPNQAGFPIMSGGMVDANGQQVPNQAGFPILSGGMVDANGQQVPNQAGFPIMSGGMVDANGQQVPNQAGFPILSGGMVDSMGQQVPNQAGMMPGMLVMGQQQPHTTAITPTVVNAMGPGSEHSIGESSTGAQPTTTDV
jgi:hypothetical protein